MQDTAKNYQRAKRRFFYLSIGLDIVFLLVLQLSGASLWIRNLALGLAGFPILTNGIYALAFFLVFFLWQFPINYFSGFVLEHRYQLSAQKFSAWLWDEAKKGLLSGAVFVVAITALYFLLGRMTEYWWLAAGGLWLLFSLFLARIMPNFIIPIFFKYEKVANEELRQAIFSLFKKCGVALKDVYAINLSSKTKKANAFVCGLGNSRRVVLSDTLLADFTTPQIESVVAHELGHYKHHDILKLTVMNTIMILGAFYLIDLGLEKAVGFVNLTKADIATLPFFILGMLIFSFLTSPILNGYSRRLETQADEFSLRIAGHPDAFIAMMDKLAGMNLAEYEPSRLDEIMLYDHPPIGRRIKLAKKFASEGKI